MPALKRLSNPVDYGGGSTGPVDRDIAQVADGFGGGLMGLAEMAAATEPAQESPEAVYERNYGALVDLQKKKESLRNMREANALDAESLRVGAGAVKSRVDRVTASVAAIEMASAVELQGLRASARLALQPYEDRTSASAGNPYEAAFHRVRESQDPAYMSAGPEMKQMIDESIAVLDKATTFDMMSGTYLPITALVRELDSAHVEPERAGELAAVALGANVPEAVVGKNISYGSLSMGRSLRDQQAKVPTNSRVSPAAIESAEAQIANLRSKMTAMYGVTWKEDGTLDSSNVSDRAQSDGYAKDLEYLNSLQSEVGRFRRENPFLVDPEAQRLKAAPKAVGGFIDHAIRLDVGSGSPFVQARAKAFQERRGVADPQKAFQMANEERELMKIGMANAAEELRKSIEFRRNDSRQTLPTKSQLNEEFQSGLAAVSAGESGTLLYDEGLSQELARIVGNLPDNPSRIEVDMARSQYESKVLMSALAIGTTYFTAMEQANGAGKTQTVVRDFFHIDDIKGISARAKAAQEYSYQDAKARAGNQPTIAEWRKQYKLASDARAEYSGNPDVSLGENMLFNQTASPFRKDSKLATRLTGHFLDKDQTLEGQRDSLLLQGIGAANAFAGGRVSIPLDPELLGEIRAFSRRNSPGSTIDSRRSWPWEKALSVDDVLAGDFPADIKLRAAQVIANGLSSLGLSDMHRVARVLRDDGTVDYRLMTAPESARLPDINPRPGAKSRLAAMSETDELLAVGQAVLDRGAGVSRLGKAVPTRPGLFASEISPDGGRIFASDVASFVEPRSALVAAASLPPSTDPKQLSDKLKNVFDLLELTAKESLVPVAARMLKDPANATFASYQLDPLTARNLVYLANALPDGDPSKGKILGMAKPYEGLVEFQAPLPPASAYGAFGSPLVLPSDQAAQLEAARAAEAAKKAATAGGAPGGL